MMYITTPKRTNNSHYHVQKSLWYVCKEVREIATLYDIRIGPQYLFPVVDPT